MYLFVFEFDYDVLSSPFHVIVVVLSNYYFLFFIEVEPAGAFKQWPRTRTFGHFVHYLNPCSFPRLSVSLLFTLQSQRLKSLFEPFRSQHTPFNSNPHFHSAFVASTASTKKILFFPGEFYFFLYIFSVMLCLYQFANLCVAKTSHVSGAWGGVC